MQYVRGHVCAVGNNGEQILVLNASIVHGAFLIFHSFVHNRLFTYNCSKVRKIQFLFCFVNMNKLGALTKEANLLHDPRWSRLFAEVSNEIYSQKNCFTRQRLRAIVSCSVSKHMKGKATFEDSEAFVINGIAAVLAKEQSKGSRITATPDKPRSPPYRRSGRIAGQKSIAERQASEKPHLVLPRVGQTRYNRPKGCLRCSFSANGCYHCANNVYKTYQQRAYEANTAIACSKCAWYRGCRRCWEMLVREHRLYKSDVAIKIEKEFK